MQNRQERDAECKTTDRKSDGSILELRNVISLRYDFYGGWGNVKILSSGECRKLRDVCIFRVNDCPVFFIEAVAYISAKFLNFAIKNKTR